MRLDISDMDSTKFNKVKLIVSDVFTIYLYEDKDSIQATIFLDRMKVNTMDLEGANIDIKMKVVKGKGYEQL
ncbi:hypothetical protein ES702_00701 [subsurface metagenome]